MNKLCYIYWSEVIRKEYPHIPQRAKAMGDFTEDSMLQYIWLYKGPHPGRAGLAVIPDLFDWSAAGNYEQSKAWAKAGYNAWPLDQPKTPPGDRPQCSPTCPLTYGSVSSPNSAKGPFHWHWLPHHEAE
jgi:hypothetical protein